MEKQTNFNDRCVLVPEVNFIQTPTNPSVDHFQYYTLCILLAAIHAGLTGDCIKG